MIKRRSKNESFENLNRVTSNNNPDVEGVMDVVMADAVIDHADKEKQLEDVKDELQKAADEVTPEEVKEPESAVKNDFTAKLVLDESLVDFSIEEAAVKEPVKDGRSNKVYDNDDEDVHLDYDMFDFIYGLVTDCYPKPLNPVENMKPRKFMYIGSDKYANRPTDGIDTSTDDIDVPALFGAEPSAQGEEEVEIDAFDLHAQVSSTGNVITVYANEDRDKDGNKLGTLSAFDWIQEVCRIYEFKHAGPRKKRSSASHWEYSFDIYVPCTSNDYPMMVEEYFKELGLTMEDVMDEEFCRNYRRKQAKERRESDKLVNNNEVDKLINDAIVAAALDNTEPLDAHLKRLYTALTNAGLKYQKMKVKRTFMDAFDDGDEEDE